MRYENLVFALSAAVVLSLAPVQPACSGGADEGAIQALQQLVKNQQQQLDAQANEIETLKGMLNSLLGQTEQNTAAIAEKADQKEMENLQSESMVVSKIPRVDVSVYGQINRAGLWADNGDASQVYFVDNIFSSTRMGIDAVAKASDDLNIGGKLEYEIISNSSNEVNQDQPDSSATLKIRHADTFAQSRTLGKISLGQGSTSSDGTAERDLSGTSVVSYSAVQYQAGGQKWYDDSSDTVLLSQVKSVIDNMDGLSRRDRLRYDTPVFSGWQLSASAIEAEAFDGALSYSRKFGGTAVAAAFGYATPGDLAAWENQYSGSLSVLLGSGLNFTLAGGIQEYDVVDRDNPDYWYGKLGYKTSLFPQGASAFAVDYGMWNDFDLNGDEAQSLGLAFVQEIADWGTEFYLAYRLYALERDLADIADVNSVMAGARVKF
jgi:hypothetical protein